MLRYLTLAIDQAASHILKLDLPIQLSLEHYGNRKEKILKDIPELWVYYKSRVMGNAEVRTLLSVFTAWEMSFDEIRHGHPG